MAQKQADSSATKASQPTTSAPAPKARKTWKPKTPVQIVLEQADKIKQEIAELEDELKDKRKQLQKFEEAKKIFESN